MMTFANYAFRHFPKISSGHPQGTAAWKPSLLEHFTTPTAATQVNRLPARDTQSAKDGVITSEHITTAIAPTKKERDQPQLQPRSEERRDQSIVRARQLPLRTPSVNSQESDPPHLVMLSTTHWGRRKSNDSRKGVGGSGQERGNDVNGKHGNTLVFYISAGQIIAASQ
jgi:hypothetical protein